MTQALCAKLVDYGDAVGLPLVSDCIGMGGSPAFWPPEGASVSVLDYRRDHLLPRSYSLDVCAK